MEYPVVNKSIKHLLAMLVLLQLTGCAVFRGGELEDVSKWPPEKSQTRAVSVVVSGKIAMNGKSADAQPAMVKQWETIMVDTYKDSGLFSDVSKGMSGSDLRAEITIKDEGKANMGLAFLTGLTLYIIPSRAQDTFIVQTTFRNADGEILGTIEKRESVVVWQQLFLVFVGPFTVSSNGAKAVLSDITKATLLEAQEKHIL